MHTRIYQRVFKIWSQQDIKRIQYDVEYVWEYLCIKE